MEQQSKDTLRQGEFDFGQPAPWVSPLEPARGGTPRAGTQRERQVFAAWREELDWEERLLERVANPANLEAACQRVVSNKGAAGVDGMTVLQLQQWARHHLAELREQLLQGQYAPQAVRGVSIPKPNGGVRQLGIPTVIDRVVQQAFVQVLTPMLDPQMSESSYGFRPGRKAHDALLAGSRLVAEGRYIAVDLDLEKFFDKVNHDVLMDRLSRRIRDKRLLHYIRLMLKAGMMDHGGVCQKREQGTPQGGPLSPLLANVLLDDLDRELERRGLPFCRYADDCMVFVRSWAAGRRVLAGITRYLEGVLRLKVNKEKSRVDEVWNCTYLGYIIGKGGRLRIAPKSVERFKARVREITKRNSAKRLREVTAELAPVIRGWGNYFKLAAVRELFHLLDCWIRRRLRCYRLKQCRHPRGIQRFLRSLGCDKKLCGLVARRGRLWWHCAISRQAHACMSIKWLRSEGLISLSQLL